MSKWSLPEKSGGKSKLSAESAQALVFDLISFYGINPDDVDDKETKSALGVSLNKLQRAYMAGHLENVKADGQFKVVQHLAVPKGDVTSITYDELRGKHKLELDIYKPQESAHRTYALLGSMSGLGEDAIASLNPVDLSVAECLSTVFFVA